MKCAGDAPVCVDRLRVGDFFGEVALLLDTPRVASVVACRHCHAYTLSRDAFETLAVVYQDWWRALTLEHGVLLDRFQRAGVKIGAEATTRTHGLTLPQVAGVTVSAMLSAAQAPAEATTVPEGRLCVVCRTSEKCILSIPCGHISACEQCHAGLTTCPLCRTVLERGIHAYF